MRRRRSVELRWGLVLEQRQFAAAAREHWRGELLVSTSRGSGVRGRLVRVRDVAQLLFKPLDDPVPVAMLQLHASPV
jgi:hypothetical protein